MKKLSCQFKWMGSFFGILLILICPQNVSAWQASQMEDPSSEEIGRTTLPARSGKLLVPLIEGPNFVCEHAVFKVKNTTNSYQWSSNQPDLLTIDKDGVVKLKKGSGGLVTIRATMLGGDNTTEYIDKTIEVGAVMNESDLVVSGDSVLHETGKGLYTINVSAGKDENLHNIPTVQFEWGIKYPGEDFVHSVSKSNEASVSGDLIGRTVYDYFKKGEVSSRVELFGRVQTPCGWSDWSRPLSVRIAQKNSYRVYPNPAREKITVAFKDEFETVPEQVVIYSESAMKMIRTIRLNEAKFPVSHQLSKIDIQVADLKPGVYFLHFKSNDQTKIVRVLLE